MSQGDGKDKDKQMTLEQFQEVCLFERLAMDFLCAQAELLVNITKHVLVPKHILQTEDEKKALLAK